LGLIATVSSLSYAWYSAAANEQSKASSTALADKEKARLKTIRQKLQTFYISGGEILNRPLPKDISEKDFNAYSAAADAWLNETNNWIGQNLGAGASARFLDTSAGVYLSYDRAANAAHNAIITALIRHRENLSKMIEINAWDAGEAKK
jgi:hypothetical protein